MPAARWRTFHCSLPISNRHSIVAVCHALHDVCLSTAKKITSRSSDSRHASRAPICAVYIKRYCEHSRRALFPSLNDRNQKDELPVVRDSNRCHDRFENDKVTLAGSARPIISRKYMQESVCEIQLADADIYIKRYCNAKMSCKVCGGSQAAAAQGNAMESAKIEWTRARVE